MLSSKRPSPIPSPQTVEFWKASAEQKFMVPRCRACNRSHWYPRPFCPHCYSQDVALEKASGRGKVYSFTVLTRDKSIVAYVKLDEGPIMLTSIVDTDPEKIGIGSEVTVTFRPTEDGTLVPLFRGA